MTVAVMQPPERKGNTTQILDVIGRGLQMAQAYYGIKTDMAKLDAYKTDQETAKEKLESAKDERQGILPGDKQADLIGKGAREVDPTTPGAYRTKVRRNGEVVDTAFLIPGKEPESKRQFTTDLIDPKTGKRAGAWVEPGKEPVFVGAAYTKPEDSKSGKFTRTDKEFWDKTLTEFRQNKAVTQANDTYLNAALGEKFVNLKTQAGDAQLATLMNKFSRDESAPSESQLKGAGASKDAINQAKLATQKLIDGSTLTDQDRLAIKDVLNAARQVARKQYVNAAEQLATDKASVSDLSVDEVLKEYIKPSETLARLDSIAQGQMDEFMAGVRDPAFRSPSMPGGQGTTQGGIANQRSIEDAAIAAEILKRRGTEARNR